MIVSSSNITVNALFVLTIDVSKKNIQHPNGSQFLVHSRYIYKQIDVLDKQLKLILDVYAIFMIYCWGHCWPSGIFDACAFLCVCANFECLHDNLSHFVAKVT